MPPCGAVVLRAIACILLLLYVLHAVSTAAPRGRALIIGNAAYSGEAQLKNPLNDAIAMAELLGKPPINFEVILVKNASKQEMEQQVEAFSKPGQGSHVGVFYFSGHGVQVDNQNYLIPVDARINSAADVRYRAVEAQWILGKMEDAGYRFTIAILDACRNNPYKLGSKSTARGLARMKEPASALIAYATAPDTVADDNPSGRNGLYTHYLLEKLPTPGLSLTDMFVEVTAEVKKATQGKQVPWTSSSLAERFFFVPGSSAAGGGAPHSTPPAPGPIATVIPAPPPASPVRTITNSIGMQFTLIPAGEFEMGAQDGDKDEQPVHRVRISKPFFLGMFEVTQSQWQQLMGVNPSRFKGEGNLPVGQVSWEDVQEFIRRLNQQEGRTLYRLPTEAEWEYAARAGSTTAYSFGNDVMQLGDYAWYSENSEGRMRPVGQKKPNAWGLYDMHGNVWEWVQDWYGAYTTAVQADPVGPSTGSGRVVRGGSWYYDAGICRAAFRGHDAPRFRGVYLGFRLLRLLE